MTLSLTYKLFREHLVEGELGLGNEIGLKIDQTLTQDATGTMAYLQFEALGLSKVMTELSVSYVDHNLLQSGFENMDDHVFLQSVAAKYGIYYSRPGNGICHQVHLERFGIPGKTLLGSDSHTPTNGGLGMLAIGAGGLDVAMAMGGHPFYLKMPKVVGIKLQGRLQPWVSAKDVILEILRQLTVKGGVGKIIEYFGEGIASLSVPERATITNMGAELGAMTSIFPSDERTKEYLSLQKRVHVWKSLQADENAYYDEKLEIDLSSLEPLVACPQSPDNVHTVREYEGMPVQQVLIGSCTNSSFKDLTIVASVLKDKHVHPHTTMAVNPGSKQVYENIAANGALTHFIMAGARMLEAGCGGCIGMGSAPGTNVNSVRTFNRNFPGRSGTPNDNVYLVSPEVAAATALNGVLTDPRRLGSYPKISWPELHIDDSQILPPPRDASSVEIIRGPNIKPLPYNERFPTRFEKEVIIKVGDNISTDTIMKAGAKVLPLRSNIPAMAEYVFEPLDPSFARLAKEKKGGIIVAGANYGQGSSREHAALAPMYLGIKAVIAKNFARIHKDNLVNVGILPLEFVNEWDYEKVEKGDVLFLDDVREQVTQEIPITTITITNKTKNTLIATKLDLSPRQRKYVLTGGLLNYVREKNILKEPKEPN